MLAQPWWAGLPAKGDTRAADQVKYKSGLGARHMGLRNGLCIVRFVDEVQIAV